jgi:adenosylhomocysteine nucleosidase
MNGLMICGAADWELEPLLDALDDRRELREEAWTYWEGAIAGRRVVVARTDWGPINAVAATLCGIRAFEPAAVISQGMAGAHSPSLNVGDIVVAERTVDHSAYKSDCAPAGAGISMSRRVPLYHRIRGRDGALAEHPGFRCHPPLVEAALGVPNPHGRVLRGTAGSAYQYNRELDCINALRELYGASCEDMESAYSHGVSIALGVPFAAIRIVSNSEWNHPALERDAGRWCAAFVADAVRRGLTP